MDFVWLYLVGAVLCEIAAAIALRFSDGFSKLAPTLGALAAFGSAFFLVSVAMRKIPVSIAYPIWAGAGTAGVALVGITLLNEKASVRKVAGVTLVVLGIVLLHLNAGEAIG